MELKSAQNIKPSNTAWQLHLKIIVGTVKWGHYKQISNHYY